MKKILTALMILFVMNAFAADMLSTVLVVSIDALHPDAVTVENAPNIFKAAEFGIIKLNGKSTKPPKTLVSHAAMFTGITPENGGRKSNAWKKGDTTIDKPTIFDTAKGLGYNTAYIYSKGKLAYLVNDAVDYTVFSKEYPIDKTTEYVNSHNKSFVFLHISGLDNTGPEYGWMSKEYIEDFRFIDEELKPLLDAVMKKGKYLLVILSDHAGHEKEHGCDHPDDYKLPFIAVSDTLNVQNSYSENFQTYMLSAFLTETGAFAKK